MSLPPVSDQHDRDKEMDALLKAIQPASTGELQDYFAQSMHSSPVPDNLCTGTCREPAEQCEVDIHDCRYAELNR